MGCVSRSIARHWLVPDLVLRFPVADGSGLFWYPRAVRRSVVAPLALLLPLAACRFDFDPIVQGAKPGDAMPDAPPPPVLPCGAPSQFPIPAPAGAGSGSAVTLSAL